MLSRLRWAVDERLLYCPVFKVLLEKILTSTNFVEKKEFSAILKLKNKLKCLTFDNPRSNNGYTQKKRLSCFP